MIRSNFREEFFKELLDDDERISILERKMELLIEKFGDSLPSLQPKPENPDEKALLYFLNYLEDELTRQINLDYNEYEGSFGIFVYDSDDHVLVSGPIGYPRRGGPPTLPLPDERLLQIMRENNFEYLITDDLTEPIFSLRKGINQLDQPEESTNNGFWSYFTRSIPDYRVMIIHHHLQV